MKKFFQIFSSMFVTGLFTFGGGLAMIPQMTRVFVQKRGWVTDEEIADYVAVSQSLPGAIAINLSVMIGYRIGGAAGALAAAFGSVLPSFLVLIAVTVFYQSVAAHPVVLGALRGIRAAVAALLFVTVWSSRKLLARPAGVQEGGEAYSRAGFSVWKIILCLAAAGLVLAMDVNPIWVILGGGILGSLSVVFGNKSG